MSQWKIIESNMQLGNTGALASVHHTEKSCHGATTAKHVLQTPLGVFEIQPLIVALNAQGKQSRLYTVSLTNSDQRHAARIPVELDTTDSLEEAKCVVKEYIANVISICNNHLKDLEDN